jgi:hypothetical protein
MSNGRRRKRSGVDFPASAPGEAAGIVGMGGLDGFHRAEIDGGNERMAWSASSRRQVHADAR